MKSIPDQEYRHELTPDKKEWLIRFNGWFNHVYLSKLWKDRNSKVISTIPTNPTEKYIISKWLDRLENEYHNQYDDIGKKIDLDTKEGIEVWKEFQKEFMLINLDISNGMKYYNDKEQIVMKFFKKLYLLLQNRPLYKKIKT